MLRVVAAILLACGALALLPLVVVDVLRLSNRFVGPLLRLRRSLRQLARGEYVEPIATGPVRIIPVSPVIGLHVGAAVGIVYETQRAWS